MLIYSREITQDIALKDQNKNVFYKSEKVREFQHGENQGKGEDPKNVYMYVPKYIILAL